MVDQGARNLVVPSRSGVSSQAASKIVSDLTSQGINIITPQCDVSSSEELSAFLNTCTNMAPIRGCINLAMVLQVSSPCPFDSYQLAHVLLGRSFREHDPRTMERNHSIQSRYDLESPPAPTTKDGLFHPRILFLRCYRLDLAG